MKEYVTMKEASLLIGKTPKTVKNYIKRGIIKNYFLVDGKYGQEYQISVRDLEPLGIKFLDVLKDNFSKKDHKTDIQWNIPVENKQEIINKGSISIEAGEKFNDITEFVKRYENLVLEMGNCRDRLEIITEENKKLRQEIEEKDMLIKVLMKKG